MGLLPSSTCCGPSCGTPWFLISEGYKTYLLLSRNFLTFWPRRGVDTPPWARDLIVTLARRRFGDALDEGALDLRFRGAHDRPKAGVAPVEGELDPGIRFFVEANPGHAEGDELCCLGVLDARLLASWPPRRLRHLAAAR
jgi:hypothetical protein